VDFYIRKKELLKINITQTDEEWGGIVKFGTRTNRKISFIMTVCILCFSGITFYFISQSLANLYVHSLEDMTSVAGSNIQEIIEINKNEAVFITQMDSFKTYISSIKDGEDQAIESKMQKSQTYDYLRKKVETSTTIKSINVIDNKNKIILSNDSKAIGSTYIEYSGYSTNDNGFVKTTIQEDLSGDKIILIRYPVKLYDAHYGFIFMELNFRPINAYIENYKFGSTGNLFIITKAGEFIGNSPSTLPSSIDDIENNEPIKALSQDKVLNMNNIYKTQFKNDKTNRYMVYTYLSNLDAILATSISKSEVNKASTTTSFPLVFLLVVILILLYMYRYIISTQILKPLSLLSRSLYMLKKGDLRARYNYNVDNEFGNLSVVFNQTISSFQKATRNLKERETKNNIILSNITDVIWEYDVDTKTITFPENWITLIGEKKIYETTTYTVNQFLEFIHINYYYELQEHIDSCVNDNQKIDFDCQIRRMDNSYIWVKINGFCTFNMYDEPYKIIGSISNITNLKMRESELLNTAQRDEMTNFYKKREMERIVNTDIQNTDFEHYLMIIDLDGFKSINDTLGHLVGDEVIILTAEAIKSVAGSSCHLCRFGGDEFVVYTRIEFTLEQAERLAKAIIDRIAQGYHTKGGHDIRITCSAGISKCPTDGSSYVELMGKSDLAIYQAKSSGKNQFVVYDDIMHG